MAELLQHLLTVGQVRSHELRSVHLDPLFDSPGGQASLEEGKGNIVSYSTNKRVEKIHF